MQGSRQQQAQNSQQALKSKKQAQSSPFSYQSPERTASQCPNCGTQLPEDAIFCPECGFSKGLVCPKCGKTNVPSADICQYCNTWLLTGKCKFCYADVDEEDAFCAECAKPKNGIPCPKCGQLSIFDFCKNCGAAVTKEAIEEIQAAQKENAFSIPAVKPVSASPTPPLASAPQIQTSAVNETIDSSSQRIALTPKQEIKKEEVQQQEPVISIEEAKKQAKENAQKKFSTPQAARRWHMARRHPDALGWLCNFAGCVHLYAEGGPDNCHDPSKGGADFFGTMDDIFMNEFGWYQPKK